MIRLEKKDLLRKNESRLDYHMKSATNACIIFALGPKILMKILITRSVDVVFDRFRSSEGFCG